MLCCAGQLISNGLNVGGGMKVALFAFHFAEYSYRLACALADQQHEVLFFMHRDNAVQELGEKILAQPAPHLEIIFLPKRGPKDPGILMNALRIVAELKRFGPDVIHYQESLNYAFTLAQHLFHRIPLVLTIHDHIPHSGVDTKVSASVRLHRKYLRKHADLVIVHGEKIRAECEILFPWLKGKIASIPHGPLGAMVGAIKAEWEKGVLLFFGRIEKYKGLGYLIEAVKILREEGVPVKVVIAGRGSDLENYRSRITDDATFDLLEHFIPVDQVQNLFMRANMVVLPYTDATQSGVVALALQYGRPVVATDVGSIGEVVRDGFNGLLVPPKDAAALAAAIRKLIEDQELAGEMAQYAVNLAKGELSWQAIAARTVALYRRAVA